MHKDSFFILIKVFITKKYAYSLKIPIFVARKLKYGANEKVCFFVIDFVVTGIYVV